MEGFPVKMKKAILFPINSSACNGSCLLFSYFNEKPSACIAHGQNLQPAWLMFCFSLQWLMTASVCSHIWLM